MDSSNPYNSPKADLQLESPESLALHEPRALKIGRGVAWFKRGFDSFKRNPGTWLAVTIVGMVIFFIVALIPFVNLFSLTIHYILIGGLMIGLKAQSEGESFELAHLFAGFKQHFVPLLLLSIMYMVAWLLIFSLAMLLASLIYQANGQDLSALSIEIAANPQVIALIFLVLMALMTPALMATWFAPALIVLHDLGTMSAMRMSFVGCAKNMLPFVLYGLFGLLLMVLAMLPAFLGFLALIPIFVASTFVSYREIFVE